MARKIDAACRSIGFLVIAGHRIPRELIADVQLLSNRFFDLPADVKAGCRLKETKGFRGYRPIEASTLAYSRNDTEAAPDHRELFSIGPLAGEPRNVWPDAIEGFEDALSAYYRAMDDLARILMRLFALGLGLKETWFDDKIDDNISALQLSNYPEQVAEPRKGQLRASAHSDFGSLTILKTEDKPGGLEVWSEGQWFPVPFLQDTFIVNIGDLMSQWTNDRWVSTLHRVVNPPRDAAGKSRRLSLVFFHQPNDTAIVECLPTCTAEPPKYAPVTSGDHLRMRIAQTFKTT